MKFYSTSVWGTAWGASWANSWGMSYASEKNVSHPIAVQGIGYKPFRCAVQGFLDVYGTGGTGAAGGFAPRPYTSDRPQQQTTLRVSMDPSVPRPSQIDIPRPTSPTTTRPKT
jgi:hypothetical protein